MSAAGTPVIDSAHSGVKDWMWARNSFMPVVRVRTNASSISSSRAMTWAMANSSAASEPTRMGR